MHRFQSAAVRSSYARPTAGKAGLRVDAVQFAGFDQGRDVRPVCPALVAARGQGILSRQLDRADGTLDAAGPEQPAVVLLPAVRGVSVEATAGGSAPALRHLADARPFLRLPQTKAICASVNLHAFMHILRFQPNPKLKLSSSNRFEKREADQPHQGHQALYVRPCRLPAPPRITCSCITCCRPAS